MRVVRTVWAIFTRGSLKADEWECGKLRQMWPAHRGESGDRKFGDHVFRTPGDMFYLMEPLINV
jgi:hypothetical protein